jgi:hypothetical protein
MNPSSVSNYFQPFHFSKLLLAFFLSALLAMIGVTEAKDSSHLLGPTGMFGENGKKDIKVSKVDKGSPADGKIKVGDVIEGAAGKQFSQDPRKELAAAINLAETTEAGGALSLMLNGGKQVELTLKVYGAFSETAPYDCPKTDALVTDLADHLLKSKDLTGDRLALSWLGLMATGEKKYIDAVKSELPKQEWAHPDRAELLSVVNGEKDGGYVGWYWGYQLIALSEYYLMTGDKSVLPGIESYALALSLGQDAAGTWGHRMTSPNRMGRLPGYSHINQPSLSNFIGLCLAQKCGVDRPELIKALDQCHAFFSIFTGEGTLPYGVHEPNSREYSNNGMSGSAAVAMSILKDDEGAKFFSKQVAAAHGSPEQGHANYFFNLIWSPLGANVAGPEMSQGYADRVRWIQTLYRSWQGEFTYDGNGNKAGNPSGSLLITYCIPRKQLVINGKDADPSYWVKGDKVQEVLNYASTDFSKLTSNELLAMFGHEAPQLRRAAPWTLRGLEDNAVDRVEKLIREGSDTEKISAIGYFGYQCPPELAKSRLALMGQVLNDKKESMEVRAAAAGTIAWYVPEAFVYYDDILKFVMEEKPDDRFQLINKDLAGALAMMSEDPFKAGLVKDKDLFYGALNRLAKHPRQGVRGDAMKVLRHIPLEDFYRVAAEVKAVALNRDLGMHSYHNPTATALPACQLASELGIRDGLDWAMAVLDNPDGKGSFKLKAVVGSLDSYGKNAKSVVEDIKKDKELYKSLSGGKSNREWNSLIKQIDDPNAKTQPLISFDEAVKAGKK